MRSVSSVSRRPLGAVAVTCVVALGVAACSSDSSRFDQPVFHGTSSTGSIAPQEQVGLGYGVVPRGSTMGAGSGMGVQQQSLAAPSPSYPGQSYPSQSYPSAGYQPPVQPDSWQGSVASPSHPTAPGGTAPVGGTNSNDIATHVGEGEQRLIVPRYSASQVSNSTPKQQPAVAAAAPDSYNGALATTSATPRPQPAPPGSGRHEVQPGETLYSISRRYRVPVNTLAAQNGLASPSSIKSGQVLVIPGADTTVASDATAAPVRVATAPVTPPPAQQRITTVQPAAAPASAVTTSPAPQPRLQTVSAPVAAPSMQAAGEGFRWPVRGRVISSFGEKSNGTTNDGINIAVPEGTSVRAAENGVVIYSGSELEGFGKLVLVRHANDWVTAYAHNSELLVNRGDTISRGQVIARAGKTGNVNSPQLRFELRKGSNPVDPLKHMNAL